jgi:hypothetical protein
MVQGLRLSPDDQLMQRFIAVITKTELHSEVNFRASEIILGPILILSLVVRRLLVLISVRG